jgi:hypothetical protein
VDTSRVGQTTSPVLGQVVAARRIAARDDTGRLFSGFVLLGGLNYARGDPIIHDPETNTDVVADLDMGGGILDPEGLGGLLLVAGVVAAAAVGMGLFMWFRRKGFTGGRPPRG